MKRTLWLTSGLLILLALVIFSAGKSHAQGLDSSSPFSALPSSVIEPGPGSAAVEIDGSAVRQKTPSLPGGTRLTPPAINWNNILLEQRERLRRSGIFSEPTGPGLTYKNLPHRNYEAWDTAWFYERLALAASRVHAPAEIESSEGSAVGQRIIPEPESPSLEKEEPEAGGTSSEVVRLNDGTLMAKEISAREWAVSPEDFPPARFSAGAAVSRSSDAAAVFHPGVERTVYAVEARAKLFEFLDNQIKLTQSAESRETEKDLYRTVFTSRLVLQSTAVFDHFFGQTRLHLDHESAGFSGGSFSAPVRRSNTFSFSNRFNDRLQADASLKTIAATGARNPAASVTVKPFSLENEMLKSVEITTKYEEVNRVSALVSESDIFSFFLRNQYRGWKAHYNYRSSVSTGPLDLHDTEQRHRLRLDYGLTFEDIDVSPYVSVDVADGERASGNQAFRVGTDLSRDLERRYRMNMQLFCGLAKKTGVIDRLAPLTGMGVSINLASGLFLTGSLEMTASQGSERPVAFGDVELSQTF